MQQTDVRAHSATRLEASAASKSTTAATPPSESSRFAQIMRSPWLIWGLAATFFFVDYFARVAPSVMANDLMRAFGVSAFALGGLSSFFYYPYVIMQLPVGIMVDHAGPRRLLIIATLVCATACLCFGMTTNIYAACGARFLLGFASAFAFVSALKLASVWFPPNKFGFIAGSTQALGMLGAAVGEAPLAIVVTDYGWRLTLMGIGILFLGLMVLIALLVRDCPKHVDKSHVYASNRDQRQEKVSMLHGFRAVIKNPQSWLNGLYAGFLYAPTAALGELWGASFVSHSYQIPIATAAIGITLIFIGWGLGGPFAGWLSDTIGRRKPVMIASSIACLILLSLIIYLPALSLTVTFVLMFLYGICNAGVGVAYAVAGEINPRAITGTSLAFANMASIMIGAMFHPLIGKFLDMQWSGAIVAGVPVYTAADFRNALFILPVCLLISVMLAYKVKETHCKAV